MNRTVGFLAAVAALLLTSSCGREICVGPIGNCKVQGTVTQQSPSTGGVLEAKSSADEVSPNNQFTITVTGGTAPYTFNIASAQGGQILGVQGNVANVKAPGVNGVSVAIRVRDSKNNETTKSVWVR